MKSVSTADGDQALEILSGSYITYLFIPEETGVVLRHMYGSVIPILFLSSFLKLQLGVSPKLTFPSSAHPTNIAGIMSAESQRAGKCVLFYMGVVATNKFKSGWYYM